MTSKPSRERGVLLPDRDMPMASAVLGDGLECPSNCLVPRELNHKLKPGTPWPLVEVARAVRRVPLILERLAHGSLNMTTVRLLSPYLTGDNHREMIDEAAHR